MKVGLVLIIAEHKELKRAYSYQKTRNCPASGRSRIRRVMVI